MLGSPHNYSGTPTIPTIPTIVSVVLVLIENVIGWTDLLKWNNKKKAMLDCKIMKEGMGTGIISHHSPTQIEEYQSIQRLNYKMLQNQNQFPDANLLPHIKGLTDADVLNTSDTLHSLGGLSALMSLLLINLLPHIKGRTDVNMLDTSDISSPAQKAVKI